MDIFQPNIPHQDEIMEGLAEQEVQLEVKEKTEEEEIQEANDEMEAKKKKIEERKKKFAETLNKILQEIEDFKGIVGSHDMNWILAHQNEITRKLINLIKKKTKCDEKIKKWAQEQKEYVEETAKENIQEIKDKKAKEKKEKEAFKKKKEDDAKKKKDAIDALIKAKEVLSKTILGI